MVIRLSFFTFVNSLKVKSDQWKCHQSAGRAELGSLCIENEGLSAYMATVTVSSCLSLEKHRSSHQWYWTSHSSTTGTPDRLRLRSSITINVRRSIKQGITHRQGRTTLPGSQSPLRWIAGVYGLVITPRVRTAPSGELHIFNSIEAMQSRNCFRECVLCLLCVAPFAGFGTLMVWWRLLHLCDAGYVKTRVQVLQIIQAICVDAPYSLRV